MVQTKRVTFSVQTLGAGQPDYAQPESLTTLTQTLEVKYPEQEVSAHRYDDFAELAVGTDQTEYVIGTNANAQKTDSWASGTLAKAIDVFSTEDVFVRFNYADAVQHEVPAKLLKHFTKRVERIFLQAKNSTAVVKLWIEG